MPTLSLRAVLGFDGKGFELGMAKADSITKKFGSQTMGDLKSQIAGAFAGGAIVATITKFASHVANAAGKIKDTAEELAMTTDEVQGFDYVLKKNNATIDDGVKALNKLEQARQDALKDPSGRSARAFAFFGVSQQDLISKTRVDLFQQISMHMQRSARSGAELTELMELTGSKIASKIRPALSDGFQDAVDKAREAKMLIESIDINRIDRAKKRAEKVKDQATVKGVEALSATINDPISAMLINALVGGNPLMSFGALSKLGSAPSEEEIKELRQQKLDQLSNAQAEKAENARAAKEAREARVAAQEEKIASIQKQVDEAANQNRFNRLSEEEQRNELLKKRIGLLSIIKALEASSFLPGVDMREQLSSMMLLFEQNQAKLDKFPTAKIAAPRNSIQSDSLVRVGNFLGNGGSAMSTIAQKHLDATLQVAKNTKVIADKLTKSPIDSGGLNSLTPN